MKTSVKMSSVTVDVSEHRNKSFDLLRSCASWQRASEAVASH